MKYRFKYIAKRGELIGEKRLKEILEFFAIKIYSFLSCKFFFLKYFYHIKEQLRKVKL